MINNELNKLEQDLQQKALTLPYQEDNETDFLKDKDAFALAEKYNISIHDIYSTAFNKGITPYRYIRNLQSFTVADQKKLWESSVAIIGAGGLGGHVILLLARLGIGNITAIDHDVFDETNLNRQALSSTDVIGKPKVEVARDTLNKINPAISVNIFHDRLSKSNSGEVLKGSNIIVDALDNILDRFTLEDISKKLKVPLVHGAVAGFEGQLMTVFPEDTGMEAIYGKKGKIKSPKKNPAPILGVPAVTPAIIASYQAMEVIKILLGKDTFRNMMVYMDIEKCESRKLKFQKD